MLITVICWIIALICVALLLVACYNDCDPLVYVSVVVGFICVIIALLGTAAGISNSVDYELMHQKAMEERNAIVYRIEKQANSENVTDSFIVNGGLYSDIVEFNAKVRNDKKWGNNNWTDWFNGWAYADLDEIDINKYLSKNDTVDKNNNKTTCFYCDLLKTTNAQVGVEYCPYCGTKLSEKGEW